MTATAITTPFAPTGDTDIDVMTNGSKWILDSTRTITWAIADPSLDPRSTAAANTIQTFRNVLAEVEKVANIHFQYVGIFPDPATVPANIVYTGVNFLALNLVGVPFPFQATARAYFPSETMSDATVNYEFAYYGGSAAYPNAAGDVWLNTDLSTWPLYSPSFLSGSFGYFLILHETGHALGLKHPHDDGGTGRPTLTNLGYQLLDIDLATVMSYNELNNASYGYLNSGHPVTPMVLDIFALQYLYGPNNSTGAGNDTYVISYDGDLRTIWDSGGIDTINASNLFLPILIDLNSNWAAAVVDRTTITTFANGVVIENAYGSNYADTIAGNEYGNALFGNGANDIINGLGGNDTLAGGSGNDTMDGGAGVDRAVYSANRAAYTVSGAGATVTGPEGRDTLFNIERLQFSDKKVALDLGTGQAAGNTVRIIGAAFDAPAIQQHPDYVGIGLSLFDSGASMLAVCQRAIGAMGPLTNTAFVNTVYQDVVGVLPSATERGYYVGLLQGSGGTMTQADLLMFAANTDANAVNINLVGLQQSGVEFV